MIGLGDLRKDLEEFMDDTYSFVSLLLWNPIKMPIKWIQNGINTNTKERGGHN